MLLKARVKTPLKHFTEFLQERIYQSIKYNHSSAFELAKLMYKFSTMDEIQFNKMSIASTILSTRINSRTSAANFLSALYL